MLKTLSLHQKYYPCPYRDRDPVDGDDEDAVCPGGQAAAHGAQGQRALSWANGGGVHHVTIHKGDITCVLCRNNGNQRRFHWIIGY